MSDQQEDGAVRVPRDRANALLSKQGVVITALANDLLRAGPGDQLTRIQEYAVRFDVSVGTVQTALRYLQAKGGAMLETRGRLGSFVHSVNYPLLWSLALNQPISGALPLPYSRRFEGLATGVRQQFERRALDLELRFTRGSAQRLQELIGKTRDWALMSRFAAETAVAQGVAVSIALLLGPDSYMAQHVLLLRQDRAQLMDNMRVGVDMQSSDHVYAVQTMTRDRHVELVDIDYSRGLRLLVSGVIDATVWSQEDVPADTQITVISAAQLHNDAALTKLSEGALVIRADDAAMLNILLETLDVAQLGEVAQEVVRQSRRPAY